MILFFHKLLMILTILIIIAGTIFAIFLRHKQFWLKIHKYFNLLGCIFLVAGLAMAVSSVEQHGDKHLAGFHPIAGIAAGALMIISLLIGFYQFQTKNKMPVRKIHRLGGRFTLLTAIFALISGIFHAHII